MDRPIDENTLQQCLAELASAGHWSSDALAGLAAFVRTADDYDLFRVNPIHYAKKAGLPETGTIDLFVHAAKAGLFEMDWNLLCAYCPQVANSFRELEKVHPHFQCEFCNAINDVALDDYIQVTFTVSGKLRDNAYRHPESLPVEDYYLRYHFAKGFIPPGGMTPEQIVAVLSRGFFDLEAGARNSLEFELTPGRFEVLDLSHNLLLVFFVEGETVGEAQTIEIRLDDGKFDLDRPTRRIDKVLGEGSYSFRQATEIPPGRYRIDIDNRMNERGRFWIVQYPPGFVPHRVEYHPFLSGKRLLITPAFRDLYGTELVNESEGLPVNDMTYLFTDLKGSTPLYDAVGDVNAYFMVRQHFEILSTAVRAHGGIIVKTIGDAIMAAFARPADAVRAGIDMVTELQRYNRSVSTPLSLKVGIHKGRSIAVALNDRIDYFGQDVNIAARIQGLADGDQICISDEVMQSPGVDGLVEGYPLNPEYVPVRGVDEKIEIHRVSIEQAAL